MSIPLFSKNFWRYPKEVLSFLMEDPTSYWGSFNSVISRSIVHGVDCLFYRIFWSTFWSFSYHRFKRMGSKPYETFFVARK